jgi:tetratricopeptide (TPR) repeat protein
VGTLYMKMHDYYIGQGKVKEAAESLDKALARLNLYENLDPVYPPNYYRMAQIYISRRDFKSAEREYLNDINGWKCYRKDHNHGTPEAYTYLGNTEYALGKQKEAFEAYGKALELNPNAQPARNQYEALKPQFGSKALKNKSGINVWVEPKKATAD